MVASTPKEERKPGTLGFIIYIGIILLVLVICGLLHSVILLSRYLLIHGKRYKQSAHDINLLSNIDFVGN